MIQLHPVQRAQKLTTITFIRQDQGSSQVTDFDQAVIYFLALWITCDPSPTGSMDCIRFKNYETKISREVHFLISFISPFWPFLLPCQATLAWVAQKGGFPALWLCLLCLVQSCQQVRPKGKSKPDSQWSQEKQMHNFDHSNAAAHAVPRVKPHSWIVAAFRSRFQEILMSFSAATLFTLMNLWHWLDTLLADWFIVGILHPC